MSQKIFWAKLSIFRAKPSSFRALWSWTYILHHLLASTSIDFKTLVWTMNNIMKTTYISYFHTPKSGNMIYFSYKNFDFNFQASISSIEFWSERSRASNFRSSFDQSKNWVIFFRAFLISILVELVNLRAIWAKIRAILCLVSTLLWRQSMWQLQGIQEKLERQSISRTHPSC